MISDKVEPEDFSPEDVNKECCMLTCFQTHLGAKVPGLRCQGARAIPSPVLPAAMPACRRRPKKSYSWLRREKKVRILRRGTQPSTTGKNDKMDIHRCRFVPFPASPINALAFSHPLPTASAKRQVRLAIGRKNGDIEIWDPLNGKWFHETTIHGGRDRTIDSLVWVTGEDEVLQDGSVIVGRSRLFSIGHSSTITEWDLEKGKAKKHASGQHGDIWCLGAQPAPRKELHNGVVAASQPQRLVAGTIDGSIALYSIDDDDLQFQRTLVKTPKKDIKMVSIAFQSRQVAVVGCSDSSIRVYDLRRGELLRKMTLGKDLIGDFKDIIVWSVKCLKNGDIVSGDSTGQICIWDGKTYTQAQRIQGHKSDVLSLATGVDGQTIVSGGMDRRTALYRPMKSDPSRWQRVLYRKYHDHDVKTMASFEGLGMSVVVTGGQIVPTTYDTVVLVANPH